MSAKPSAAQLRQLAKMGIAMPDGSYYIRDAEDLDNAIRAVGRGQPQSSHNSIRKFIMKRAAALKLSSKIPANWNPDGSLKQPAVAQSAEERGEALLAHFGRKGMKWGEHVYGEGEHASADAARAARTSDTIRKHGIHSVSSADLQHLVSRQNLEQQHAKLTAGGTDAGKKVASDLIKNVAKQQAQALATQYAQQGVEHVTKAITRELTSSGKHGH